MPTRRKFNRVAALCGRPASVHSYRRQTYPERDELFDNELAVFEYPQTIATIRSTLLEIDGPARRHFIVCGEKGIIRIQPPEPPVVTLTIEEDIRDFIIYESGINTGYQPLK